MTKRIFLLASIATLVLAFTTKTVDQKNSIEIQVKLLNSLIEKTDHTLMLKKEGSQIIALNSNRNTIYPNSYNATYDETFYIYKVSELKKMINNYQKSKTKENEYIRLADWMPMCPPSCP